MALSSLMSRKSFGGKISRVDEPEYDINNISEGELNRENIPEAEEVPESLPETVEEPYVPEHVFVEPEDVERPYIPEEEDFEEPVSEQETQEQPAPQTYSLAIEEESKQSESQDVIKADLGREKLAELSWSPDAITGTYIALGQVAADVYYGAVCDDGLKESIYLLCYNMILAATAPDIAVMRQEFEERGVSLWREESPAAFSEFKSQLEGMF